MSNTAKKEPWPKHSILDYTKISDGEWGYLIVENGIYSFTQEEKPSDKEIMNRWSIYLTDQ
ncbi:MAG: hypothetical protein ACJAS1_001469 [Oleiphilaceae bacterium]|jgi:hypothetical protein